MPDSTSCTGNTLRNQPTAPANKTTSPTTLTAKLVTKPAKMSARPKAVTKGHGVEAGISLILSDLIALSCSDIIFTLPPHHIHDRKHDDPHCVDEMPIPGDHLDALAMHLRQMSCQAEDKNQ